MKKLLILVSMVVGMSMTGCSKAKLKEDCSMDGTGQGSCNFTNTGKGAGSECGKIVVFSLKDSKQVTASATICSSKLSASSTKKVSFSTKTPVKQLCHPTVEQVTNESVDDLKNNVDIMNWKRYCSFVFVKSGETLKQAIAKATGGAPGKSK